MVIIKEDEGSRKGQEGGGARFKPASGSRCCCVCRNHSEEGKGGRRTAVEAGTDELGNGCSEDLTVTSVRN